MTIEMRTLGKSGLKVSAIGLGCMSMSGVYGDADEAQSTAVIHHALDRGINFLDSADVYGNGQNEELVGRAIKGRRDRVLISTKATFRSGEGAQRAEQRASVRRSLVRGPFSQGPMGKPHFPLEMAKGKWGCPRGSARTSTRGDRR